MTTHDLEQSKRAKARWALLRKALLQKPSKNSNDTKNDNKNGQNKTTDNNNSCLSENDSYGSCHKYSIHRFKGFELLDRKIIDFSEQMNVHSNELDNIDDNDYDVIEYEIKLPNIISKNNDNFNHILCDRSNNKKQTNRCVKIRTREKKPDCQKVNIHDLMSHLHYGVDNTGNTRVWECSTVVAHLLVTSSSLISTKITTTTTDKCQGLHFTNPNDTPPLVGLENILSLAQASSSSCHQSGPTKNVKRLNVIELGSGMAAIPALSLAAIHMKLMEQTNHQDKNESKNEVTTPLTTANTEENNTHFPLINVVITDGHPKCIENNKICARLTNDIFRNCISTKDVGQKEISHKQGFMSKNNNRSSLRCFPLLWKAEMEGMKECESLLKRDSTDDIDNDDHLEYFDLCLVSDCIHFINFHAGLIASIGRLLRVNGYCLLCQPRRGDSLAKFIKLIHFMNGSSCSSSSNHHGGYNKVPTKGPLFEFNLFHEYDEKISFQHRELLKQNDDSYDENIHYPLLLVLKKLREYDDDIDTSVALKHVEERDNKT